MDRPFGIAAVLGAIVMTAATAWAQSSQQHKIELSPDLIPGRDRERELPPESPIPPPPHTMPVPPSSLPPRPAIISPRPSPQPRESEASPPVQPTPRAASTSRTLCEALESRVFVTTRFGSECIGYFASPVTPNDKAAVFHFPGDFTADSMALPIDRWAKQFQRTAERAAKEFNIPFIVIARPGTVTSTGNHNDRKTIKEFQTMSAAIDQIKARYRFQKIGVSGQSGGGSLAGGMLSLRSDISCAVPGSGALDFESLNRIRRAQDGKPTTPQESATYLSTRYSPIAHIRNIPRDANRRIFVVGDPRDRNTFFEQQRDFAYRVHSAGHHAQLLYAPGVGDKRHGVGEVATQVAGLCMQNIPDDKIEAAMAKWWQKAFKTKADGTPLKSGQFSNAAPASEQPRFLTPEEIGAKLPAPQQP